MNRAILISILTLVLLPAARARADSSHVLQFNLVGTHPLGYDAACWFHQPFGETSTSTANVLSGSGAFQQDAHTTTNDVVSFGFIGLWGTFDGTTFSPLGVAYAATSTAAADILANGKTFDSLFGESMQTFMDDIRTPNSGLSLDGRGRWNNAEGSIIPLGTTSTLLYFSPSPTAGGTLLVTLVPEPTGIAVLSFFLPVVLRRRRRPASDGVPLRS